MNVLGLETNKMKKHYTEAALKMIQSGTDIDKVLEGLRKTLTRKGHTRLYSAVLRSIVRILETHHDTGAVVVVAKDSDTTKLASDIDAILTELDAGKNFVTKIDQTIIGGVIVKNNNVVVDRSYKTKLTNIYRATTN